MLQQSVSHTARTLLCSQLLLTIYMSVQVTPFLAVDKNDVKKARRIFLDI